MINAELTNYATDETTTVKSDAVLGSYSTVEISYDGGRLNVYCGSILVFSTMDAGIDFSLSLKPC